MDFGNSKKTRLPQEMNELVTFVCNSNGLYGPCIRTCIIISEFIWTPSFPWSFKTVLMCNNAAMQLNFRHLGIFKQFSHRTDAFPNV